MSGAAAPDPWRRPDPPEGELQRWASATVVIVMAAVLASVLGVLLVIRMVGVDDPADDCSPRSNDVAVGATRTTVLAGAAIIDFDGRWWSPTAPVGADTSPASGRGVLRLVSENEARFEPADGVGAQPVSFRPVELGCD